MSKQDPLITDFLLHKEINQGRAAGTVNAYSLHLERLQIFLESRAKRLLDASSDDLKEFSGLHLHARGIAPRSRRTAVASVRQFFSWLAKKTGAINPAEDIPYPKTGIKLPHFLPKKHSEALLLQPDLATLQGARDAAILSILLGAGLRVSGVISLNLGSLIFDADGQGKEVAFLRVIEKGGNERLVPLPDESLLFLRAYFGHDDLRLIDRTLPCGDQVLFTSLKNTHVKACDYHGERRRLSTAAVRRMVIKYGERAGIPRQYCHPHALRHTFGTELSEAGVDLLTRQALMGHKSADSTKIYTHLSTRALKRAIDKGNPLARIKTPVSGLVHLLRKDRS